MDKVQELQKRYEQSSNNKDEALAAKDERGRRESAEAAAASLQKGGAKNFEMDQRKMSEQQKAFLKSQKKGSRSG